LYSKLELGKVITQKESGGIRKEEEEEEEEEEEGPGVGGLNSQAKAIGLKMFLKIHPALRFPPL
jgi:hypothetical protein